MSKKLTSEEFIEKAKKVHDNKYDYSKVIYKHSQEKVCIICPIHGEFQLTPAKHLMGLNCPKCSGVCRHTTETFILKAMNYHGDKYDYSKVNYVNNETKVIIICPIHGEFTQTPHAHLCSQGCPKCAKSYKLTTESFIEKAKKVHDNKYDYSKVIYKHSQEKVCIICPIHGEFQQTPSAHLYGQGCSKCIGNNKKTTEEFIEKAKEVHGDKYDYSKVNYINAYLKVCIICPIHGVFYQQPTSHLRGVGCGKCINKSKKKKTTEEFIEKAKEVHGNKYDYSKVIYKHSQEKVCIICPIHGEFQQIAGNHLQTAGCPKCAKTHKYTTEEFIEKARKIHGARYDYSKVNYVNCISKVCIICPEHGEFYQDAWSHLQGKSCPKCNVSKLEKEIIKYCEDKKIEYIYQYRNNCLKQQSLDFYLPEHNAGIECQGIQHFKPVEFFGNEKDFNKNRERDFRKLKICKENKIRLFYFSKENYFEFLNEPLYKDTETLFNEISKLRENA